ncbi:unnamed protein product [Pedinophyceae sp. YPF-701]|nr:unnamed protein product [Pedinophyceae sp. YPF-701]
MPAPAPVAQPAAGGPAGFAWGSGRTIQLDADAVARGRAAIGLDEDDGAAARDAGGGGGAAGAGEAQALDVAPGLAGFGWATGRKIEVDRQAIARGGGVAAAGGFTGFGWATGRTIAVDEAAIAKGKAMLGLDGGGDDDNNESGGGSADKRQAFQTPFAGKRIPFASPLAASAAAKQWRWVVWKLAAQELKLPAARGLRLTRATVQKQLCDRYRREIAGGQRPSLRRILNGDSPASLPLVLMVSHVDFPPAVVDPDAEQGAEEPALVLPPPRVELSDGWYCVRAEVDPPLARLFRQERIVEGDKLHVRGAQLSCNNPGEPWEVGESVSLRVNCNATSPAAWDARLGFQRPDITLTRLDHVHPDGGVVPACVFAVQAVGPLLMYERGASSGKQQGSAAANEAQAGVFRTAKADSVAESLHAGIVTREAEKASTQARGEERAWCERVARGQARASPAERAYASTMLSADGGGAGDVGDATEAEMHAVFACRQDAVGKRAEELLKRSLEKLRVPQQRDVSPAIVVVAAAVFPEGASRGSFPDAPLAQLRIWRPDDALTSQLKPGAVIVGTMLAPRGGAGRRRDLPLLLQTTRSTSMHVVGTLPVAGVTSAYEPVLVHSTASLLGVAEPAAGWCTRRGGVDCGQGAASVMRRSPSLFALVGVAVGASQVTPLEHGRLGQWVFVCDAGPGTAHGQTRWLTAVHVTGYPESGAFVAEGMCGVVAFEALEVHPLGRDAKNGLVRAAVGAGTRVWQAAPPGGGEAWRAAETWARSAEGRQVVEGLRAEVGQLVRGGSR